MQNILSFGILCNEDYRDLFICTQNNLTNITDLFNLADEYRQLPIFAKYFLATNKITTTIFQIVKISSTLITIHKIPIQVQNLAKSYWHRKQLTRSVKIENGNEIEKQPREELWILLKTASHLSALLGSINIVIIVFKSHKFILLLIQAITPFSVLCNIFTTVEEWKKLKTGINYAISINSTAAADNEFKITPFTKEHKYLSICIIIIHAAKLVFISMHFFLPPIAGATIFCSTVMCILNMTKSALEIQLQITPIQQKILQNEQRIQQLTQLVKLEKQRIRLLQQEAGKQQQLRVQKQRVQQQKRQLQEPWLWEQDSIKGSIELQLMLMGT